MKATLLSDLNDLKQMLEKRDSLEEELEALKKEKEKSREIFRKRQAINISKLNNREKDELDQVKDKYKPRYDELDQEINLLAKEKNSIKEEIFQAQVIPINDKIEKENKKNKRRYMLYAISDWLQDLRFQSSPYLYPINLREWGIFAMASIVIAVFLAFMSEGLAGFFLFLLLIVYPALRGFLYLSSNRARFNPLSRKTKSSSTVSKSGPMASFEQEKDKLREDIFVHKKFQDERYETIHKDQETLETKRRKIEEEENKSLQKVQDFFEIEREELRLVGEEAVYELKKKQEEEIENHETNKEYIAQQRKVEEFPRPSNDYKKVSIIDFIIKSIINEQANNLGEAIEYYEDWRFKEKERLEKQLRAQQLDELERKEREARIRANEATRRREEAEEAKQEIERQKLEEDLWWEEEQRRRESEREEEIHQQKIFESNERLRLAQEERENKRLEEMERMFEEQQARNQERMEELLKGKENTQPNRLAELTSQIEQLDQLIERFKDQEDEEDQEILKRIKKERRELVNQAFMEESQ